MMLGPEGTAKRAAGWLAGRIPARLRLLEDRYDLHPGELPDPAQVLDHERGPIGLEDWPSVFVLPQRTTGMRLVDVDDDAAEQYLTTYTLQVLAWVRASSYESTNALRNRYALAIREALLERKSLRLPSGLVVGDPDSDLAVDPRSIRENYSPMIDDEGRTIAGVTIDVDVTVRERLDGPAGYGPATSVEVDTALLPTHPSLG